MSDSFQEIVTGLMILQIIQTTIMLLTVFTPMQLNKETNPCWFRNGRKVFRLLTKINFVLIPILTIGLTVWKALNGTIHVHLETREDIDDVFTVWPIACSLTNLFVMIYYLWIIRPYFEPAICGSFENLTDDIEEEEEEIKAEEDEGPKDLSRFHYDYRGVHGEKYFRRAGDGPYRINKTIKVRLDMYSMLFVTSMRAEYIYHFKTKEENRQKAIDALNEAPAAENLTEAETKAEVNNAINDAAIDN